MSFLESGSLAVFMGHGCIALKGSTVGCAGEQLTEHSLMHIIYQFLLVLRIVNATSMVILEFSTSP